MIKKKATGTVRGQRFAKNKRDECGFGQNRGNGSGQGGATGRRGTLRSEQSQQGTRLLRHLFLEEASAAKESMSHPPGIVQLPRGLGDLGLPVTLQMALATKARVEEGQEQEGPGARGRLWASIWEEALLGAAAGLSDSPQAASGSGGSCDPPGHSAPVSVSRECWTGCTVSPDVPQS